MLTTAILNGTLSNHELQLQLSQIDISSNVGKSLAYEAERMLMLCVRANFDSTSNEVQQLDMRAQHFRLEYTFTSWLSYLWNESRQLIIARTRDWAFRYHQRMATIGEGSYHSNLHVVLARCIPRLFPCLYKNNISGRISVDQSWLQQKPDAESC